jgi:hypothetical protein
MFEKFTAEGSRDFHQRYIGTYGMFRKGDRKTLVRLDKIDTVVKFSDCDGIDYTLQPDSDDPTIGFEFIPPKTQYYNTEHGVRLVSRIASKQYSRGICDKNTRIQDVRQREMGVSFTTLRPIFAEGSIITPAQTLQMFDETALSGQFALSTSSGRVWCLGNYIGMVYTWGDSLSIELTDWPLWGTELQDCLRRNNMKGTVV